MYFTLFLHKSQEQQIYMYTVKQENFYYRNLIINSNLKKKTTFWRLSRFQVAGE